MLLWLPNFIANIIDIPFSKSSDDDSAGYEGEVGMGRVVVREATKGDKRIRKIVVLVVLPIIFLVHYLYWDPFYSGVVWAMFGLAVDPELNYRKPQKLSEVSNETGRFQPTIGDCR